MCSGDGEQNGGSTGPKEPSVSGIRINKAVGPICYVMNPSQGAADESMGFAIFRFFANGKRLG